MNENQRAALLISQSITLMVQAMGMHAENMNRQHRGEAVAYVQEHFEKLVNDSGVHWNGAMTMLQGQ